MSFDDSANPRQLSVTAASSAVTDDENVSFCRSTKEQQLKWIQRQKELVITIQTGSISTEFIPVHKAQSCQKPLACSDADFQYSHPLLK